MFVSASEYRKSELKRLDTRHEVVLSRVKLFRMFLPGRATRSKSAADVFIHAAT